MSMGAVDCQRRHIVVECAGKVKNMGAAAAQKIIDVNTGEVKVAGSPTMLRSAAIGSCIVVAALDSEKRIGAIAHIMLPGRAPESCCEKTKYAADAIDQLIDDMNQQGCKSENIEVCLVGAGNVMKKEDNIICENNIKSVTTILAEKNIPVRASALGGMERKSVFLDTANSRISYTETDEKEKTL